VEWLKVKALSLNPRTGSGIWIFPASPFWKSIENFSREITRDNFCARKIFVAATQNARRREMECLQESSGGVL
jgi:hypothetical protein